MYFIMSRIGVNFLEAQSFQEVWRHHRPRQGRLRHGRQDRHDPAGVQKALSANGIPRLDTIDAIMRSMDYQLMPRRMA
jgi:uncharacterized protein YcaQ